MRIDSPKGGVGKTTTAVNVASGLARRARIAGGADYGQLLDEIEDRLERYGAVYDDLIEKANRTATGTTASEV